MAEAPTRFRELARQYHQCQADAQIARKEGDILGAQAYVDEAGNILRKLTSLNEAHDALVGELVGELEAELEAELEFLAAVYGATLVEASEGRRGLSLDLLKDRIGSVKAALKLAKG